VSIASDDDREGEGIAQEIFDLTAPKMYNMIVFHEITREALEDALANPRKIDKHLVHAQKTRRLLDRIVGYATTKSLWKTFNVNNAKISTGRVQACVLQFLIENENMIRNHVDKTYYTITASIKSIDLQLVDHNNEIVKFEDVNDAIKTLKAIKNTSKITVNIDDSVKKYPPPPFTTSTLQQTAFNKLKLSPATTMKLAQELYERGYITYMRTDSVRISKDAQDAAKAYVLEKLSADKVDRMIATGKWSAEIAKRVGDNFQYGEYADIILPLTFGDHWVLLICNYEARAVTVVYFKRETQEQRLDFLVKLGTAVWKAGCKGGLECKAQIYNEEKKFMKEWTTSYLPCCKRNPETVESISYKRMISLMYEIACRPSRSADCVA
jgi:hypothetical protein